MSKHLPLVLFVVSGTLLVELGFQATKLIRIPPVAEPWLVGAFFVALIAYIVRRLGSERRMPATKD
jgi:hypothetical protein